MKKLLLLCAFAISTLAMCAQEKNYIYCELVGTSKLLSSKVNVQVDFGQETSFWKGVSYVKDEKGKKKSFNSMVDAMNFFGKQGWEFVQAYVVSNDGQNVYHWLLKKEVEQSELEKVVNESTDSEKK